MQYYCNQQKDLDTKGSEAGNLTKVLLNSTLVKSFNLATKDINLIHKQTLEHMQSDKWRKAPDFDSIYIEEAFGVGIPRFGAMWKSTAFLISIFRNSSML